MYSQMLSKLKQSTPQPEIGEVVTVLAGNNAGQVIANNQGKYVLADRIYNIADYPELYNRIGSVGATPFRTRTSGTTSSLYAITYGNGIYLAGGNGGALRTSTDGITWSAVTSPTTSTIRVLIYGNGIYVMGDDSGDGTIRSSTNGTTWTTRVSVSGVMYSGNYSQGIFVIGGGNKFYSSTNGTSWTLYSFPFGQPNLSSGAVLYANGKYLAYGSGSGKTSTDALNWTTITAGPTGGLGVYSLAYGNGIYLCSAYSGSAFYTSTDAYNWVSILPNTAAAYNIVYNNGLFVGAGAGPFSGALGSNFITSTDGVNWSLAYSGTSSVTRNITYGNGLYVYAGDGGAIGTSATATTAEYSPIYDVTTQFYVPAFTRGSRFYTLTSYGSNSTPTFVNYVRAK